MCGWRQKMQEPGLTPEAVIDRYLETIFSDPFDPAAFGLLVGTDADLLSRWLLLLGCPADPDAFTEAIAALPGGSFQDLALSQALAVLSVPGSVRVGFDQWQRMLTRSLLAEALAGELDIPESQALSWRVLLAASGVILPHDPVLMELLAFRGARRELLEDASLAHRLLAVVEAFDGADPPASQEAARQLLDLDGQRYRSLQAAAEARVSGILDALDLSAEREADGAERLWLRVQLGVLERLLGGSADRAGVALLEAHRLVSRRLFGRVPVLFVLDPATARLTRPDGAAPDIARSSQSSTIARSVRLGERFELVDRADQSVADRQVLRELECTEGLSQPLVDGAGNALGALVFAVDEEDDHESAMAMYADALARHLVARPVRDDQPDMLARYRQREEKRLRELVHEANNPLSIVNNYLHILELRLEHEPQAVEHLKLIGQELRRAGDIIAQARILPPFDAAAEEPRVERADLDINQLSRHLVELHRGLAADHRVSLADALAPGALVIHSDQQRLAQILNNLVRNAIEASPGASVTVSTIGGVFREGVEGVLLGVADTGPGLPRQVVERLAEPKQSTKGGDHSGLGLHIVHRLVREVGGSLDVRTGPGQGTAFTIFLPLQTE
jgi:signal transduction histidine kinase